MPEPKPIECPFLRAIRDETVRLHEARAKDPKAQASGFLASEGHLAGILGVAARSPQFQPAVEAFCGEHGLAAEPDGVDAIRFTVKPARPSKPALPSE